MDQIKHQMAIAGLDPGIRKRDVIRAYRYTVGTAVSYTHLRAHETVLDLVCRLLLETKKKKQTYYNWKLQTSEHKTSNEDHTCRIITQERKPNM